MTIEEVVVTVGPDEKHWHGASPNTAMTHIAIQEALDGKAVEWLRHCLILTPFAFGFS